MARFLGINSGNGRDIDYALSLHQSTRLEGHLLSLRLMQPWMVVHDSTRYMIIFGFMMNNFDEENNGCMKNGLFLASLSVKSH